MKSKENGSVNRKYRIFAVCLYAKAGQPLHHIWKKNKKNVSVHDMHCLHVQFKTHFRLLRSHSDTTSKNPSDTVSVSRVLHHPDRCK